jgi:hypothetical protein
MVPMGDNFNHHDVTVVQELVNVPMHLEGDSTSTYFTRSKFMNDFSPLFSAEEVDKHTDQKSQKEKERVHKNIHGHFDREKYIFNSTTTNLDTWKHMMESMDSEIWDVPFIRDTYDEDNDTAESSSDEENPQNTMMAMLQGLLTKNRGEKTQSKMKKGLSFFIKEEKKMLFKKELKEKHNEEMKAKKAEQI